MGIFVGCMDETNKRKQSLDLEELPRSEEMESGGSTFSAEYNILFFFRAFPSSPHPNRDLTCQKISKMMAMEVEKKPGPEWLDLSSPASPSDRIIGIIRPFPGETPGPWSAKTEESSVGPHHQWHGWHAVFWDTSAASEEKNPHCFSYLFMFTPEISKNMNHNGH